MIITEIYLCISGYAIYTINISNLLILSLSSYRLKSLYLNLFPTKVKSELFPLTEYNSPKYVSKIDEIYFINVLIFIPNLLYFILFFSCFSFILVIVFKYIQNIYF
jgi:hypothetical protein